MKQKTKYIPVLRWKLLTPIYDCVLSGIMREDHFKRELIRRARLQPGQAILDLGCGTATLTAMLKKSSPQATVIGLDADSQVLQIGRQKAEKAGGGDQSRTGIC